MHSVRPVVWMVVAACLLLGSDNPTWAQGLVWKLPAPGEMVHYEGTYKQTTFHPAAPGTKGAGNEVAEWICHLTIKSLGSEEAEFEGTMQPCRWLEIKVVNGKPVEGLDPGPVGTRIYKVLVPESRVIDAQVDADNIPVSFIPIVKGFRKIGNKDAVAIESKVLQVFPIIAMLTPYRRLNPAGDAIDVQIRQGEETSAPSKPIKAMPFKAITQMERSTSRSRNEATIWRSADIPFGLAKWQVVLNVFTKEQNDPPTEYKSSSRVEIEMTAVYQKGDAQPDPLLP